MIILLSLYMKKWLESLYEFLKYTDINQTGFGNLSYWPALKYLIKVYNSSKEFVNIALFWLNVCISMKSGLSKSKLVISFIIIWVYFSLSGFVVWATYFFDSGGLCFACFFAFPPIQILIVIKLSIYFKCLKFLNNIDKSNYWKK